MSIRASIETEKSPPDTLRSHFETEIDNRRDDDRGVMFAQRLQRLRPSVGRNPQRRAYGCGGRNEITPTGYFPALGVVDDVGTSLQHHAKRISSQQRRFGIRGFQVWRRCFRRPDGCDSRLLRFWLARFGPAKGALIGARKCHCLPRPNPPPRAPRSMQRRKAGRWWFREASCRRSMTKRTCSSVTC